MDGNPVVNPVTRSQEIPELTKPKMATLGLQHAMAMFGATVLVPILTGLNVGVALFTAGIGTLIFHLITKGKVPAYLGSSFAFIAGIQIIVNQYGISAAQGGIIAAGIVYAIMALIIYLVGPKIIENLFPPVVTGPVIMVIGLGLASTAIGMAKEHWLVAIIALLTAALIAVFAKGFSRLIPILFGLGAGYLAAIIFGLVDFTPVVEAAIIGLPKFTAPVLNWSAISVIAPIAFVTMVEHVGDVLAIGATVGKGREFVHDPGIHRTMLGDGLATAFAGFFGGPPNTTYSENTGVLALTKVYNPQVMRIAACFALAMSVVPKFNALINTIPGPVIGGLCILLFGMIASVGVRTMVENNVDLKKSRNLIISSVILVVGIGGAAIKINQEIEIAGMALAGILGLLLNQILPAETADEE